MKDLYNETQKNSIMLYGDLLGSPLTPAKKLELQEVMTSVGNDLAAAENYLSPEIKSKVKSFTSKGLKFSLELEKLRQRGVAVLFSEEGKIQCLDDYFAYAPPLLFSLGNEHLLNEENVIASLSLDAFKAAGYTGIFIADRSFDFLLRNNQVAAALRSNQALLVSDLIKSHATVKSLNTYTSTPQRLDETIGSAKRVFISGSRSQSLIPKIVQDSLKAVIQQGIGILIGDSNKGVDNEIIDFLRVPLYEHVTIYTISDSPRVNPEPEWATRTIEVDKTLKSPQSQTIKDRAMVDDADWGLALFNPIEKNRYGSLQVSSGTLRNMIQMLLQDKKVKLFYVFEGEIKSKNLKRLEDLEEVIDSYQSEHLDNAHERAILSSKGVSFNDNAAHVKASKIMSKYKALLKDEKRQFKQEGKDSSCMEPTQNPLPLYD